MFRTGLFNFSKGELAPALYGRIDVAAYNAAVRKALNVVILKYGGLTRRMGSRYVYEIKPPAGGWSLDSAAARLFPFEFSISQTYALLFTQSKLRLAALGGMVVETPLTIQAATRTNPILITAAYHGFQTGDEVFFAGVGGMVELNGRTATVTRLSDSSFTVNIDGTTFGAFTGDTGGITNSAPPPPAPPPPPTPPPATPEPPPYTTPPGGGRGGGGRYEYETQIP